MSMTSSGRFAWPENPAGDTTLMRGQGLASPAGVHVAAEPVIEVPDGAVHITSDATVSPGAVAVAPDGTVVDAGTNGSVITTSDGVQIVLDPDGALRVDADFANDPAIADDSSLALGATLETDSGTTVARHEDGSVLVRQSSGQTMTIHPDGSIDVSVPQADDELGDGVAGPGAVGVPGEDDGDPATDPDVSDDPVVEPDPDVSDDPAVEPDPDTPAADEPGAGAQPAGGGITDPGGGGGGGGGMGSGGGGVGGGGAGPDGGGGGADRGGEPVDERPPATTCPSPGEGTDFDVDRSDLRDDAAHLDDLVAPAQTLAACWEAVGGLVQHWGLWSLGAPAYRKGSDRFAQLYQGAALEMGAIADALRRSADDYDDQEEAGVVIAGTINE